VSYLLQDTVAELWQDPAIEQLLARAAGAYANRREQLISALANVGIPARGRSGLAVWVPVADELGTTSGLLDRGWAVAPGERFRIASPPGIRIGIATLMATEIDQLAGDMSYCLHRRPRRTD
jgi:DNA-binding transcriptional MocR family regulator